MTLTPNGTQTAFARAVAAEVRALMGVHRMAVRTLAARAKLTDASGKPRTFNYLAIRLRDEQPLTLDDVDRIAVVFDLTGEALVRQAVRNHLPEVFGLSPAVAARDAEVAAEQAARRSAARGKNDVG